MKPLGFFALLVALSLVAVAEEFIPGVKRIVFLGDSITHAGHYVDIFEAFVFDGFPDRRVEVIDCGLPSETVSGLSEAGHAGGAFPRPDLHERLDRVLAMIKPDLVFACYGMNCGIYLPFDEGRFGKFQDGIQRLREKVAKSGAQMIHLTPPVFDPMPIRNRLKSAETVKDGGMFDGYDEVLARYSAWLVGQRAQGWRVIDTHGAMAAALAEKRKADPSFTFARDGVHADAKGHAVLAGAILRNLAPQKSEAFLSRLDGEWGMSAGGRAILDAVRKRGRILCDAYLGAAGHKRPGMAKGLPVNEAEAKAAQLEAIIRDGFKAAPR